MNKLICVDKKRCPKCREKKMVNHFGKTKFTKDGLQAYCKPCSSISSMKSRKKRRILAKLDLSEIRENQNSEANDIINIITQYFGTDKNTIKTKSRLGKILKPRRLCYYFLFSKNVGLSYSEMAKMFNQKQHGTITHGINWVYEQYDVNRTVKFDVDRISELLDKYIYNPTEK